VTIGTTEEIAQAVPLFTQLLTQHETAVAAATAAYPNVCRNLSKRLGNVCKVYQGNPITSPLKCLNYVIK